MKVEVLKTLFHDKLGKVAVGQVVEMNDSQAKMYLERGAVKHYATKVVNEVPDLEEKVVKTKPKAKKLED